MKKHLRKKSWENSVWISVTIPWDEFRTLGNLFGDYLQKQIYWTWTCIYTCIYPYKNCLSKGIPTEIPNSSESWKKHPWRKLWRIYRKIHLGLFSAVQEYPWRNSWKNPWRSFWKYLFEFLKKNFWNNFWWNRCWRNFLKNSWKNLQKMLWIIPWMIKKIRRLFSGWIPRGIKRQAFF